MCLLRSNQGGLSLAHCSKIMIDSEQSPFSFFFWFSEGGARERRAAKPRDARNEGGSPRRTKEAKKRAIIGSAPSAPGNKDSVTLNLKKKQTNKSAPSLERLTAQFSIVS